MEKSLREYVNSNWEEDYTYKSEQMDMLIMDYLGMVGYEISTEDEKFLKENNLSIEDFMEE